MHRIENVMQNSRTKIQSTTFAVAGEQQKNANFFDLISSEWTTWLYLQIE